MASRDEVVEIFGVRGILQTHRGTQPPAEANVGGSPVPGGHERSDGGKGGRQFEPHGGGKGKGTGKGKGKGTAGDGHGPSPAMLTSHIKKAWTLEAIFGTYSEHASRFNHIHLSAFWNALGHLARAADESWVQDHAEALASLVQRTTQKVAMDSEVRARELATIAHGVAKSGTGSATSGLMTALAQSAERRLGDCNAQELANICWACAKAKHDAPQLFAAIAEEAKPRLREFKAQELSNTAWAYATAKHEAVALFDAMAEEATMRLREFNEQALSNTFWAYATAKHHAPRLFDAIAAEAMTRPSELTAQALSNVVWACATAKHAAPTLFDAVAKEAIPRLREFNAQALSNTIWAYATACHVDARLFTALARSAEWCVNDFNSQDLLNTAWAFAKVGQLDAKLFASLARSFIGRPLDDLTAPQIAKAAWGFAKADQLDGPLFTALARSAEQRLSDFSAQDLADIAWAFANAGQLDAKLFASLARSAEQLLDNFTDEALDNAEWAFARAGQQKIVKRLRQRKKRTMGAAAALAGPSADASKCGRIVVAGGGIGGAAVAVALQSRGFDVVVLEADSSFDARKQGYGLTIQQQAATQAMGINLSKDDAPSTSHYTFSAEGHILGFFGEAFGSKSKDRRETENSGRFIHIPRQMLRLRIVDQIHPGTIRWNSKLQSFACWSDNKGGRRKQNGVTVTLTDGSTLDAALLVGSDGIFSTVRRQLKLPGDRLNYVGLVVVLGILEGKLAVPLAERRIFETVDGTTRIYAMPFTTSSTMWQLSFPYGEEAARELVKDPAALKAEIMRRCGDWHEPIPALLGSTPLDGMAGYPVYDRELLEPDVLRKPRAASAQPTPQRRVTLIGDAAHPMTPFKAQGANQALDDAVLLADSLVEGIQKHGPQDGLDAALPLFEQKMLSRSARMVVGSREKAKELHSSLALQPARKVQREVGLDMPKVIRALRANGIGAHSATDPRGLDAVVAEAIGSSPSSGCATAPAAPPSESATAQDTARRKEKHRKEPAAALVAVEAKGKRRKGNSGVVIG